MSIFRSPPDRRSNRSLEMMEDDAESGEATAGTLYFRTRTPSESSVASGTGRFAGDSFRRSKRPAVSPPMEFHELDPGPAPLSDEDLQRIKADMASHDYNFASINVVSKESACRKKELEQIMCAYRTALDKVIMAYIKIKAERDTTQRIWQAIKTGATGIRHRTDDESDNRLKDAMPGEIANAIREAIHEEIAARSPALTDATFGGSMRSYARVVKSNTALPPRRTSSDSLNVPSFSSSMSVRQTIVIVPEKDKEKDFMDASATYNAVTKAIKPVEMGIKIDRIIKGRNNSVRIVANPATFEKIRPALNSVGMKVKEMEKLNPRLLVKDIPSDVNKEQFVQCLAKQNCSENENDNIKVVYWFPVNEGRNNSAIIEVTPIIRRALLNQGRVYINWASCRVSDHIRVTQCYKCLQFGHTAKACNSDNDICGHCSEAHESRSCKSKKGALKCHNCALMKATDTGHSALDATRCPVLKRRLNDKIRTINY